MADHEAPITVDHEYENDSDYSSSLATDTTSLKSSIIDYVYENGRRYHRYKEGAYPLPNDETEQDRLDMHHHIFRLLLRDRLHLAPIGKNPQRILDMGTGTGIWAIEMADLYPSAEVVGIDLSPIQPHWIPPNCKFEVDDAEQNWTFPEDYFDLIHSRNLMQSIKDWPRYLKQMYKHVQPGGYVDVAELEGVLRSDDNTVPEGSSLKAITYCYSEGLKKVGLPQHSGLEMKAMVEAAGFVDVELHRFKQPLGGWPKDPVLKKVGQYIQISTESGFEAYALALMTRVLGKTNDEAIEIINGAIKDANNRKIHSYVNFCHVVGRKPKDP